MPETRRRYNPAFGAGAVRVVTETRTPVAEVARELGICEGTLGNCVRTERAERSCGWLADDVHAELMRLRRRCAELETERDILKRSEAGWAKGATR